MCYNNPQSCNFIFSSLIVNYQYMEKVNAFLSSSRLLYTLQLYYITPPLPATSLKEDKNEAAVSKYNKSVSIVEVVVGICNV